MLKLGWQIKFLIFIIVLKRLVLLIKLAINLKNFLSDKRKRPFENTHKVWQDIRMLAEVELLNIKLIVFELYHSSFVLVKITVIWCREDRYYTWETLIGPVVHLESF